MSLWPTYKTITAMDLVSEVSKSRPSQVWFSNRRTRKPVELEILCVTVADPLDDHSNEPGVSDQQVQAQPGMVQQAQGSARPTFVFRDRVRDWNFQSLNFETGSETQIF